MAYSKVSGEFWSRTLHALHRSVGEIRRGNVHMHKLTVSYSHSIFPSIGKAVGPIYKPRINMYLKLCDVCGFRPNMVTTLCADQDKIWRERAHYRPVGRKWNGGGCFFVKNGPFLNAGCIMYSISIFYFTFYWLGVRTGCVRLRLRLRASTTSFCSIYLRLTRLLSVE